LRERLSNPDHGFNVSEDKRCYGRRMALLRTTLLALLGLALPVGLALAVYLSSADTITAAPVALPPAAETIAQPSARPNAQPKRVTKKDRSQTTQPSGTTSTVDDHGGATSTDGLGGNSGPGGGGDSSGSGSSGSGSSGSGSSDDD
jgi:uncharacterized membrane protein YgcG